MSQEICATMQVKLPPSPGNPTGITVINVSDFDPALMTPEDALAKAKVEPQIAPPIREVPPAKPVKVPKVVAPWAAQ